MNLDKYRPTLPFISYKWQLINLENKGHPLNHETMKLAKELANKSLNECDQEEQENFKLFIEDVMIELGFDKMSKETQILVRYIVLETWSDFGVDSAYSKAIHLHDILS